MKKTVFLNVGMLLFVVVCFFCLPPLSSAADFKPIKLRVASVFPPPETSMQNAELVEWEKMITKKTDGAVTFTNFWGGTLGKPGEYLSLAKTGSVDIILIFAGYNPTQFSINDMDYMFPFGPTDPLIVTKAMRQISEEFPAIKKQAAASNVVRIYQATTLHFYFLSRGPILKLDDFKGQKCAISGRYFGNWVKAVGAVPVAAPGPERYTMLQTGVIDISMDPMDLHYAYKAIEQAPYVLDPNVIGTVPWSCFINLNTFQKLPVDLQKIFLESGKELEIKAAKEIYPFWTEKILKEWKADKNFKIATLPEADRLKWAVSCPDVPAEWAEEVTKEGHPGWEMIKRYQEITEQLGHKWLRKWGVKKQ